MTLFVAFAYAAGTALWLSWIAATCYTAAKRYYDANIELV